MTVAGLVLAAHGTVPEPGTTVHVQGHELTAEAVEGHTIIRVQLRPPTAEHPPPETDSD